MLTKDLLKRDADAACGVCSSDMSVGKAKQRGKSCEPLRLSKEFLDTKSPSRLSRQFVVHNRRSARQNKHQRLVHPAPRNSRILMRNGPDILQHCLTPRHSNWQYPTHPKVILTSCSRHAKIAFHQSRTDRLNFRPSHTSRHHHKHAFRAAAPCRGQYPILGYPVRIYSYTLKQIETVRKADH